MIDATAFGILGSVFVLTLSSDVPGAWKIAIAAVLAAGWFGLSQFAGSSTKSRQDELDAFLAHPIRGTVQFVTVCNLALLVPFVANRAPWLPVALSMVATYAVGVPVGTAVLRRVRRRRSA